MLLNRHDLDAVVAVFDDARQHFFAKLHVSADFFRVLTHSDVTFIDEQRRFRGSERAFFPPIRLFGLPNLG